MAPKPPDNRDIDSVLNLTENRSRILAVILTMVRDIDVAEDLFQETVLEVLRSQDRHIDASAFLPWACGVAKNIVRRYWERENRRPRPATEMALASLAEITAETASEPWREERAALQDCLEKLPARLNRLFMLRYGYNVKGEALAEQARIKRGSIRTTLSRLRKQLRRCIARRLGCDLGMGYEL